MVDRYRGSRTPAEIRQAEYEARQRAEEERIAQERADREALEVERLQQLADAQVSPSDWHGYDLPDYRYSGTDYSFQPETTYYRPPTGWNYETDTPEITYYEMFGEPSLADIAKFEKEFEELLASDKWTPNERTQLEEKWQSFLAGEINPWSMEVQGMYATFNIDQREEWQNQLEEAGVDNYVPRATNLTEAKEHADEVYMEVLQNAYDENPTDELAQAIEQGPLDFDKAEDVELYNSLSEDSIQRQAFDAQGAVVENYLNIAEGDAFDSESLEQGQTFSWGWGNKAGTTLLNTGTIVGAPDVTRDNVTFGEFGTHGSYSYDDAPEPNALSKAVNTTLDVLSIVYPALAPVIQGVKTTVNTGDIEEGFKTAAKTFAVKEIGSEINAGVKETFADLDIDLSNLPEPVQQVLVDTTAGVLTGQDVDEAVANSLTNQATDYVTDWAAGEIESKYGDLGQDLKEYLGLPEDYELPESLQNIVDEGTEALVSGDSATEAIESAAKGEVRDVVGGFVEDTTKELLSGAEDLLGEGLAAFDDTFIQPIIEPVKPILGAVEEGVKEVGRTVDEEVIQPLIEPVKPILTDIEEGIKTAGRTVDEEVIQPILEPVKSVVTAIDEALPHGTTPELPEGPDIDVDLPSPDIDVEQPESKVAGLFDKELREIYKHDIIELPKLFSDERLEGMLSRKYRV